MCAFSYHLASVIFLNAVIQNEFRTSHMWYCRGFTILILFCILRDWEKVARVPCTFPSTKFPRGWIWCLQVTPITEHRALYAGLCLLSLLRGNLRTHLKLGGLCVLFHATHRGKQVTKHLKHLTHLSNHLTGYFQIHLKMSNKVM